MLNSFMSWALKGRIKQIDYFMENPHEVQDKIFNALISEAEATEFGKKHGFKTIKNYQNFKDRVPVTNYENFHPYIARAMKGEENVIWPSAIKWFAKSSGTTAGKSKFIPVSNEALESCHFKGGKDLISLYINNFPNQQLFSGKNLAIGGSHQLNELNAGGETYYGDISAVIMKNLPFWAQFFRTPDLKTALMDNWEEKIEAIARKTADENITSISGVPTWTVFLIQRILELKGKNNILEVWPNLELFMHGAVSFTPYRQLFQELIPSNHMQYMETYNATEGFFGIQDQPHSDEMLLMLDYGIFYEFIPPEDFEKDDPKTYSLDEIETGKNYAIVISTNSGLWRYKIGDTIKFTSVTPYRFKITGRTKHFINAFGEELIIENAESGIAAACLATNATMEDFTAGPHYIGTESKGCHEWIVEFETPPEDPEKFRKILDQKLREVNTDYDAKREKEIAVTMPIIHHVPKGTFYTWMKKRGTLGGQNKVPRLANHREYIEDILEMIEWGGKQTAGRR